jgi:HupE / UreJ protein
MKTILQKTARAFSPLYRIVPVVVCVLFVAVMNAHAHGISEADQQAMVEGGLLRYLWLGAVHMITGYDHLLFLLGVIFYLTSLKDVFKYVTIFTLGHSITLIAATYAGITANFYLVDAVIALSVCYKAFDNLDGFHRFLKFKSPNLLAMIWIFGLIHGFGLSTRLQQLPLPEHGLLWRILSFNLGVELGQVAALAILVTVLAQWRKTASFQGWGTVVNALLFLAGLGLFAFQLTGYLHGQPHHGHDEKPASHHDAPPSHLGAPALADTTTEFRVVPAEKPKPEAKHSHSHDNGHEHTH